MSGTGRFCLEIFAVSAAPVSVYRLPGFLPFLIARIVVVFAVQIQAIVVAWQVYDLTRDPLSLAYVGLAQGSVLEHVLQQAWGHVMAALQGNPGGELYLLAGRIAMEQGNLDEALAQFDQSAQAGMDAVQLAPYRAEIAFLRQRYEEIPDMLATMPAELLQRPPFAALARYWL